MITIYAINKMCIKRLYVFFVSRKMLNWFVLDFSRPSGVQCLSNDHTVKPL